jgi:hypothetical protein
VRLRVSRSARWVGLLWLACAILPAGTSSSEPAQSFDSGRAVASAPGADHSPSSLAQDSATQGLDAVSARPIREASRPRLLVIDFDLAPSQVHRDMAQLFADVGYTVDLRPDYPRLVTADMRRSHDGYRAIMLLAGDTPARPGSMLTPRALAPLADYVRRGGILFLGAPVNLAGGLAGENERTLFNALLHRLGIRIVIDKGRVTDPDDSYAETLSDAPWLYAARTTPLLDGLPDRLQLPRAAPLTVGAGVATLVQTSPTAVIEPRDAVSTTPDHPTGRRVGAPIPVLAVAAKGRGLVVVGARDLFNPTGAYQIDVPLLINQQQRQARYQMLERLARYTIEWLHGTAAWRPEPAPSTAPDFTQETRPSFWRTGPLPHRVPDGVDTIQFPTPIEGRSATEASSPSLQEERQAWLHSLPARYQWVTAQGLRAGWVYVDRDASFQRAVRDALIEGRFNLLWGSSDAEWLAAEGHDRQKQELMEQWSRMDRLLRGTTVRWFMGSHYPGAHATLADYPQAVGAQGQTIGGMSPLDGRFWETEIFSVLRAEAVFSLRHHSVGGILIDLEMYPLQSWYFTNGFDFSDLAFNLYVRELDRRGLVKEASQARGVAQEGRFDWLLEGGRWADYQRVLEAGAERIGRRLRETVQAVNPSLMIGFYASVMPTSWFYTGLLRGAGDGGHPVILCTFQLAPDEELNDAFGRNIRLLHSSAILLGQVRLDQMREAIQERLTLDQGYWINNLATLATGDPAAHHRSRIESPRDGNRLEYLRAIAEANRLFDKEGRRKGRVRP